MYKEGVREGWKRDKSVSKSVECLGKNLRKVEWDLEDIDIEEK